MIVLDASVVVKWFSEEEHTKKALEIRERVRRGEERVMNILYVAPDVPVPHTGEFLGGATHVLKIAEGLAKRGNNVFIISKNISYQIKSE